MTAERDSMTLNEVSVPALGVEERSDEAPRAGRARPTPDPEVVAKPKRRQFTAEYRLRVLEEADRCTQPGEVGRLLRREGVVQLASDGLAQGAAQGLAAGVGREEARRETGRTQPAGCEGARARGASGSPGARVAHRAHDPGRAGKSCRAAGIEPRTRNALLIAVQPLAAQVGVAPACQALGVSRASFYRRQRSTPGHRQPRPTPARALCEAEREQILDVLAGPRFVDRAPAEVVATLLDEGHYLCSERTMYRILAADQPVRERRNQREHPQYTKPELVATAPNQTWSWDITKLLGPTKWTYFYLYVVLDIFSRYAVGWMVADRENSALAGRLIEETCHKQGVQPQVLTLHSDRGARRCSPTSKCTAQDCSPTSA